MPKKDFFMRNHQARILMITSFLINADSFWHRLDTIMTRAVIFKSGNPGWPGNGFAGNRRIEHSMKVRFASSTRYPGLVRCTD